MNISFENIVEGLSINPENPSLYEALGDYYYSININQAYLCFEHAYNRYESQSDKSTVNAKMLQCSKSDGFYVVPTSFVILSYNSKEVMIECLDAIRNTCDPGTYEIVVIDNVSTDGIRDYLVEQTDIKLALNDVNSGFAAGCNQGAKLANPTYDIMLLNNDAIVAPHSIFYMRLGLYSDPQYGATGPMCNNAVATQMYSYESHTKEEWFEISKSICLPSQHYAEKMHWLQGHALLVKRWVWDEIGGLDTRYLYGTSEDNDYGLKLNSNGFYTVLCHNSFVYHYGSLSMGGKKSNETNKYRAENAKKLAQKWGFDWAYHCFTRFDMVQQITCSPDEAIKVLEIGCGMANTLNVISYRFPNSEVHGIDINENVVKIAQNFTNVICGDIETMTIPFPAEYFDYVIISNTIQCLLNPLETLKKLYPYIKKGGHLLISAPNALHISVIMDYLRGKNELSYTKDPNAYHRFTNDDLTNLVKQAGYNIILWNYAISNTYIETHPEALQLANYLETLPGMPKKDSFSIITNLIKAQKPN